MPSRRKSPTLPEYIHRSVRLELLSSKEVQQYQKKSDVIILPVGCVEMHGPQVPLGCDTLMEWGGDILIAEKLKCLVAPPIFYMHPAASGPWPGTVDIAPEAGYAYLREVVLALIRNGFKRVILSGSHGPLKSIFTTLMDSLYREFGHVTMSINVCSMLFPADLLKQEFGSRTVGEDMMVLPFLKVLGYHGVFQPHAQRNLPMEFPNRNIGPLKKITGNSGCVPWVFFRDYQHTGIHRDLTLDDADRMLKVVYKALERVGDLPKFFARYQKDVARLHKRKPWSKAGVWSV
jgi:hypothetical protein